MSNHQNLHTPHASLTRTRTTRADRARRLAVFLSALCVFAASASAFLHARAYSAGGVSRWPADFVKAFAAGSLRLFDAPAPGGISLTALGTAYTQNFDALAQSGSANAWTDNSTIFGWYSNRLTYNASAGTDTSGDVYSYGSAGSSDRALGALSSTNVSPVVGVRMVNNTGASITSLAVSFVGEQWRQTANAQALTFEYQVGATSLTTGTWTSVPALNFTAINTGAAGALDGNSAANRASKSGAVNAAVANGQEIWFRWSKTGSTSPGLAVDSFSVTPSGPQISVTGGPLSFGNTAIGGVSPEQSFTVSGSNLTDGIAVNAPADFQVSTTSGSGFGSSVTLPQSGGSVNSTTIYVRYAPTTTGPNTGNNVASASNGATTQNVAVSGVGLPSASLLFRSKASGAWNSTSTWETSADGNTWVNAVTTPTSADGAITIRNGHTVTVTASVDADELTVNDGGILLINSNVTFTVNDGPGTDLTVGAPSGLVGTAGTITNHGQAQINGTLRIDTGGFPGTTGTYSYDQTTGSLVFNTSDSYGVNSDHTYWPDTNGPQNVLIGSGGITINMARTVGVLCQTSGPITNASNLTLNGLFVVFNFGGSVDSSPTYGNSSTLEYTGTSPGTYHRASEWAAVTGGPGYPHNVQVSGNTTLDIYNGGAFNSAPSQMSGSLTIDSGSALSMGTSTQPLTVLADANVNGTLTLSSAAGGDLKVGGNWARAAAATFTPNSRAVFFNGSGAQTVTVTGGGTQSFDYLVVDKSGGNLSPSSATGNVTNIGVTQTTGNVLQLLGAGGIDLNGQTLTMSGDGGSLLVSGGARAITSTGGAGAFAFNGTKAVTSASGGTLSFASAVTVNVGDGVDFGNGLSTVNGTLSIKSGGFVNNNPPTYAPGSTLEYDNGTSYDSAAEFPATGVQNVNLASTTQLNLNSDKSIAGTFAVNNRTLALGGNKLTTATAVTVGGAGGVSRTSGYIIGTEQKTFAGGGSFTFNVGTANGYSPVDANSTTGAGTLSAKPTQSKQPNLSGANALSRYWTLTNTGSITTNLTFHYLAGDVVGAESNYKIFKYSGGTFTQFTPTTLDTTNHLAALNGVSSFSDWTLAESSSVFGQIQFAQSNTDTAEGDAGSHVVSIHVQRTGGSTGAVSADYAVTDGTATVVDGDYSVSPATGTLNWTDGDSADKTIDITVNGDTKYEANETVNLALTNAQGGATIGSPASATLTITNDDAPPSTLVVNSTADADDGLCSPDPGGCTLREAVNAANSNADANTITFSDGTGGTINFSDGNPRTITLTSGELLISSSVTITGPGANVLTVSGNQASRVFEIGGGVTTTISGLTVANGKITGGSTNQGGGILNSGTLTITDSTVSGNSASGGTEDDGGGIYNNGTLTITDSTISNNSASGGSSGNFGGGIVNFGGTLTITDSTVSGNSASGSANFGGGIFNSHDDFNNGGTLTITDSTVSGNSASGNFSQGGGISNNNSPVNARNTIVAGNTGAPNSPDAFGTFTSQGHNLVGISDGSTGFNQTGDQTGTSASPLDPKLGPLANNGGPTQTMSLLPASPAIDAGDDCVADAAHCGDPNVTQLTTDQRGAGFPRNVDGDGDGTAHVDIGAVEVESPPTLATNNGLTVNQGATGTIDNTRLQVTDSDNTPAQLVFTVGTAPAHGALYNNGSPLSSGGTFTQDDINNNLITYTNNGDNATADSFTFTVSDGAGGSIGTTTFNITVNNAPVAVGDSYSTNEDTPLSVDAASGVLANDTDADTPHSSLTASLVSGPSHAAPSGFTLNSDGSFSYTPAQDFNGQDSFTYKANDGQLDSNTATVQINVNPVADTPSVTPATTFVNSQTSSGLVISRNAADGPEVAYFKITNIQHGALYKHDGTTQINDGDFITFAEGHAGLKFTPATDYSGGAGFDAQGSLDTNGTGLSSAATASITVSKSDVTVTVTSSQNPSQAGQQVTFTATVASATAYTGTPTGTVDFLDNGSPINGCGGVTLTSGQAQCQTSTLSFGSHPISASYSGDAAFNTGSGDLTDSPQVVNAPTSLTVNDTGDTDDAQAGDGFCADANNKCTLRAAIEEADALGNSGNSLSINFQIPAGDPGHFYYADDGSGTTNGHVTAAGHVTQTAASDDTTISDIDPDYPHSWWSIRPSSPLPAITSAVTIDGYSQAGASLNDKHLDEGDDAVLRIELDGSGISANASGLDLEGGAEGSLIRGLAVNHFAQADIFVDDESDFFFLFDVVSGNFLGTDISGTLGDATGGSGITINSGEGDLVGGEDPPERNLISGHGGPNGVGIDISASSHTVEGNYIGTDRSGTVALANRVGVSLHGGSDNTIGCEVLDGDNLISGNADDGVRVVNSDPNFTNYITGNFIGTQADGTHALGNGGDGVSFYDATFNVVGLDLNGFGSANAIAFNAGAGVEVKTGSAAATGTSNTVRGNSVHDNGGLGINLVGGTEDSNGVTANDPGDGDTGPNNLQNFPVIMGAFIGDTHVTGTLDSTPGGTFTIDVYANGSCDASGYGEGQTSLGSATVVEGSPGQYTFDVTVPTIQSGQVFTATATDNAGNTSEFSQCAGAANPNTNPTVNAATGLSRQQGSAAANSIIATAGDAESGPNGVSVTVTSANPSNGVQITNVANAGDGSGHVTADIVAACDAVDPATFTLTADDGSGGTSTAQLTVNVTANSPPTLTYSDPSPVVFGGSANVSPTAASDNGSVTYSIPDVSPALTTPPSVDSNGAVSITNAKPAGNHTITVRATDNCGATTDAQFTLHVGDAPAFSIGNVTLTEGNTGTKNFNFTVTKTGATAADATVQYATADGTATGGTCGTAGVDYASRSGALTFHPADTQMTVTVPVCGDTSYEADETFFVNLTSPVDAALTNNQGVGTIKNDDKPPATLVVNTTDDNNFGACLAAHCSLREALNAANFEATFPGPGPITISFQIPAGDPNHFYYADDGQAGHLTRASVTQTAASDDTGIAGIDPDWPHSWWTISPQSQLPSLTATATIDGYSQAGASVNTSAAGDNAVLRIEISGANAGVSTNGTSSSNATLRGLVVNRFGGNGINLSGGNTVAGCFVGTDVSGTLALANGASGVSASFGNLVGGPTADARNIISGNTGDGVNVTGGNSNTVQGNLVGTKSDGTSALGNGANGVAFKSGSVFNSVGGANAGEGNTVAFNGADGVHVDSTAGIGHTVRGNSVHDNGTTANDLGIDLGADGVTANDAQDADTGPNNLQNFPVITSALQTGSTRTITGTLNSKPNQSFTIDFYANSACDTSGNGEGQTYLGSLATGNTDANGDTSFTFHPTALFAAGQIITATATDGSGNTSEFSQCVTAQTGNAGTVQFSQSNYTVAENGGVAHITVKRVGGSDGSVSATFSTSDGTATVADNDYVAVAGQTVTFNDGDTADKTVDVTVNDDSTYEADETVNLTLSGTTINRPLQNGPDFVASGSAATLTITNDDAPPTLSVDDVTHNEGNAGTTSFTFTVTKTGATEVNASVQIATQDGTATTADNDYQSAGGTLTFAPADTTKTFTVHVNGDTRPETDETFNVLLSNPLGATVSVSNGTGVGTIQNDDESVAAGQLIISEFRLRGPGSAAVTDAPAQGGGAPASSVGAKKPRASVSYAPSVPADTSPQANDEFVELYNNTDSPLLVTTTDGSKGWALAASDGVVRFVVPDGTVIPARGHFLGTNKLGYSLSNYPAGNDGTTQKTATGDAILLADGTPDTGYTLDIPDNAGIAVFRTATPANFSMTTRLDAAGSTAESNPLYKEGAGYPALSPADIAQNLESSFYRGLCDLQPGTRCATQGLPKSTGDNAADFLFVDTKGTPTAAGQRLGAPGPENLSSHVQRNAQMPFALLDRSKDSATAPNRERNPMPNPPDMADAAFGTLSIRRRVTNNTGSPVTALRFRIVEITTSPAPANTADLRALSSAQVSVMNVGDSGTCGGPTPCTVNVEGTTVDQPPVQLSNTGGNNNGGGYNTSLSVGTITLSKPLATGATVNVQFLLGVRQPGNFRILVNVETVTGKD
jgi:CSLREA domain-containing protein